MKFLTLAFSGAMLASSLVATSAFADPDRDHDGRRDHRIEPPSVTVAPVAPTAAALRDHRDRGNRWGNDDERIVVARRWNELGTLGVRGKGGSLEVARKTGAVDQLRLEVSRGTANLRSVIIVFANGDRFATKIDERLGAGASKVIDFPGSRRIARIELAYGSSRGSRNARKAQIAFSTR